LRSRCSSFFRFGQDFHSASANFLGADLLDRHLRRACRVQPARLFVRPTV
jgi:hypothetical protein